MGTATLSVRCLALASALVLAGCGSFERRAPGSEPTFEHVLDLTHTLDGTFPYIPVPGITFPFGLEPIATLEANGVAANRWRIHEHLGTQIDAPNHFARGGRSLDQIRPDELIVPVIVIDISARAANDPDATLGVADIESWEARHGRIPDGACVMMHSGWQRHLHTPAYLGLDTQGRLHFPGISAEAANFLVRERRIWGVGVDTISFDPGIDRTYQTHRIVLGADKWALEAVAHLDRLPPLGATLFVGATKVRGATGGPVRLLGVWSTPVRASLEGRWRSEQPEPLAQRGDTSFLVREFAFQGDRWRIDFTLYADPELRRPLLSGRNEGHYVVEGSARGAPAVEFHFDSRVLTARADAIAAALSTAGCGDGQWIVGRPQSVLERGCRAFRVFPKSECDREYDRAMLVGERLFLGARPADGFMCAPDRRPGSAGQAALVRY